jgi:hypothetical protein
MSKLGKIAGSISPLIGAINGQGLFGKMLGRDKGGDETDGEAMAAAMEAEKKKGKKMAKGGKVNNNVKQKEPVTGGPKTVPDTAERRDFLKRLQKQNKDTRAKSAKKNPGYAKGGRVGDGCAQRGRTRGRIV